MKGFDESAPGGPQEPKAADGAIVPSNVITVEAKPCCGLCGGTEDVQMAVRLPACVHCRNRWSIDPNWKVVCQICKQADALIPLDKVPACAGCKKRFSVTVEPSKVARGKPLKMTFEVRAIAAMLYSRDGLTYDEVVEEVARRFGVVVSRTALRNWFEKMEVGPRAKREPEEEAGAE